MLMLRNLSARVPLVLLIFPLFAAAPHLHAAPSGDGASGWQSIGPYGGTVLAVAASPTEPDLALAGMLLFGESPLFRTTDGGQSWHPVDAFAGVTITDIAFANDGTAYVATPELRRSTDGGVTWTTIPNPFGQVLEIAIDPATGDLWLGIAGFLGGIASVIHSTDGGATWTDRSPPEAGDTTALALVPGSPPTLYAGFCCTIDHWGGLWVSTDGGITWTDRTDSLPAGRINRLIWDGTRVLVAGGSEGGGDPIGVLGSVDGGVSWTPLHDGSWPNLRIRDLDLDPGDPSVLLAATDDAGIHRSDDGGATWSLGVAGTAGRSFNVVRFAPSSPDVALAGEGTFLFHSSDAGVFRSEDGGLSFSPRSSGLRGIRTSSVAVHPDDLMELAAAVSGPDEGSVYTTSDGGSSWTREPLPPTRFSRVEYAPDATLYAVSDGPISAAQEGLYRRETNGTWTAIGPDQGAAFETQIADLHFSTHEPELILLAGNDLGREGFEGTIWRSLTSGTFWEKVYETLANGRVTSVEIVADGTDETLLAGFRDDGGNGGALRSVDGGNTWSDSSTGLPAIVYSNGLCSSPSDPLRLYLATEPGTGLFTTVDGGLSWSLAGPLMDDLRTIACDGDLDGVVYVGTPSPSALLRSTDFGATFEPFATGLDAYELRQIVWTEDPAQLWAAATSGVWRYDLPVLFADGFESGDVSAWSMTVSGP
jgi:photosystem II stability/assembly factor-like uncharacterized protein